MSKSLKLLQQQGFGPAIAQKLLSNTHVSHTPPGHPANTQKAFLLTLIVSIHSRLDWTALKLTLSCAERCKLVYIII